MPVATVFLIGFLCGYLYRGGVRMFNIWYRYNKKLIKDFISEYKKLNKRKAVRK